MMLNQLQISRYRGLDLSRSSQQPHNNESAVVCLFVVSGTCGLRTFLLVLHFAHAGLRAPLSGQMADSWIVLSY